MDIKTDISNFIDDISKKTNLGSTIKSVIDKGSLVSDKIINDLMDKI